MLISITSEAEAAQALRKIRKESGVSQQDLSLASNISRKHISQLETGDANGSMATWLKLFGALGASISLNSPASW